MIIKYNGGFATGAILAADVEFTRDFLTIVLLYPGGHKHTVYVNCKSFLLTYSEGDQLVERVVLHLVAFAKLSQEDPKIVINLPAFVENAILKIRRAGEVVDNG